MSVSACSEDSILERGPAILGLLSFLIVLVGKLTALVLALTALIYAGIKLIDAWRKFKKRLK